MVGGWALSWVGLRCPSSCSPRRTTSGKTNKRSRTAYVETVATRTAAGVAPPRTAGTETDPAAHAAAFSRLLGLPQPRLIAVLERCPDLFALSPEALAATLGAVSDLTGLQPHHLPQLATADPSLLLQPDRLKRNMRDLAQALCLPPSQLPGLLAREPALLALSGPQVEVQLEALEQLLMGPDPSSRRPSAVLAAARDSPGTLLLLEPAELERRMAALETALGSVVAKRSPPQEAPPREGEAPPQPPRPQPQPQPPPRPQPPAPTAAAGAASLAATQLVSSTPAASSHASPCAPTAHQRLPPAGESPQPHPQPHLRPELQPQQPHPQRLRRLLSPLLLSRPSLLSVPPELLAERAGHLAAKAGVSVEQVLSAAPANPNLLAMSSCHLDRTCFALAAALAPVGALPPYRAAAAAHAAPSVAPTVNPVPAFSSAPFASAAFPSSSSSAAADTTCGGSGSSSSSSSSSSGTCCQSNSQAARHHPTSSPPTASPHSHHLAPQPSPPSSEHPLLPPPPSPQPPPPSPQPPLTQPQQQPASSPRPPESVAASMLVASPRLLGQNVGALVAKWQLLAGLCGRGASGASAPGWAARLAAASVPERAELLDVPYAVLARLRFLSDHGLQGEVDLLEVVRASDELFQLQYPNFKQWLRG